MTKRSISGSISFRSNLPDMKWTWEGIFSMDVPDEWQVREKEGVIEVVPPASNGAVHVSVLRRALPQLVQAGEATRILEDFASKQDAPTPSIIESALGAERIARSVFESTSKHGLCTWEVEVRVWPSRAIVSSLCFDGKDETLRRRANQMFQSIEPVGGKAKK